MSADRIVRVGVAAILWREVLGRIPVAGPGVPRLGRSLLMGRRKGSHGTGTWSFPGGHLEPGETVAKCAARETLEETGVPVSPLEFRKLTFTNDIFTVEDKHYITLYMVARWPEDAPEPRIIEPNKCDGWQWQTYAPSPLFLPVENLLKSGFDPWRGELQ